MLDSNRDWSRDDGVGPSASPTTHTAIMEHQFKQLMSATCTSSSQSSMDDKLVQFQEEVRLGKEKAAAKALKKPVTRNLTCTPYNERELRCKLISMPGLMKRWHKQKSRYM